MEKIKIAFADNHLSVLESISHLLDQSGQIEVILRAKDGVELLQRMPELDTLPDVCLIDIKMPKMDGFDTVAKIKARWPDMKTIFFSGYLKRGYLERMIQLNVNSYLNKDIHPREIVKAIQEVYHQGIYYTHNFSVQMLHNIRRKPSAFQNLSEMERKVLYLIVKGKPYQDIGHHLGLTEKSVEAHRGRIFSKLDVRNKMELLIYVMKYGYMDIDQDFNT